jgi:hypothetical protein
VRATYILSLQQNLQDAEEHAAIDSINRATLATFQPMRSPSIRGCLFRPQILCPKRWLCPKWSTRIVRDPASRHKTPSRCQLKPRPVCSPCVRNVPAELCLVGSFDLQWHCIQWEPALVLASNDGSNSLLGNRKASATEKPRQPKSLGNACDSRPKAGCLVVTVSDGYQSSSNDISGERMLRGNVNDMRDRPRIRFKLPPLTCPALMPAARS